jgi:hypothetical protein
MNGISNPILSIFAIFCILFVIWLWQNPIGLFGYHFFGFTVYSTIPIPYFDLKIHTNGSFEIREKSHFVSFEEVEGLLAENPDFLIIGTGYDQLVKVDEKIINLNQTGVVITVLKTGEAIEKFNKEKRSGKNVTAIIHSTC